MKPSKSITEYLAQIGRKGGQVASKAKSRAAKKRKLKYWSEVKAGIRKTPKVGRPKKNAPEAFSRE